MSGYNYNLAARINVRAFFIVEREGFRFYNGISNGRPLNVFTLDKGFHFFEIVKLIRLCNEGFWYKVALRPLGSEYLLF